MTNDEIIKTLTDADCALAAWKCERGIADADGDWYGVSLALGAVRDSINRENERAQRIALWRERLDNPQPISGYVLEWRDKAGNWYPSEFTEPFPWCNEFANWDCDLDFGTFPELGENCCCGYFDDWSFRLGVDWDKRHNPVDDPHASGIWGGVTNANGGNPGELWRVRKVTISGELSQAVKDWVLRQAAR